MTDTAPQPSPQDLLGKEVTAFGYPNGEWSDEPDERPGPFEGQLYAVQNPHTGETELFVGTAEVDPATVTPLVR